MKTFCRFKTDLFVPFLIGFAILMASCGGGGSDISTPTPVPNNPDNNPEPDPPPELGVTINSLNTEECPNIKVYVSVYDENNRVIEGDPAMSVKVIEDGIEQTVNLDLTWLSDADNALSVILAMDYSLSMVDEGSNETEMKEAVREFVTLMKPDDKAAIVKFFYTPQVMVGLTSDKDALNTAIDAPPISNMYTNIYDTIYSAVDLLAAETGPVAVILISDGGHTMTQVEGFLPPEEYALNDGLTYEGAYEE